LAFSSWLKVDLHIHSVKSNEFKKNDYKGSEYSYNKLIEKLSGEDVNLFSITDHNTINVDLYKELIKNRDVLISNELNFVIGCELDIYDTDIYSEVFHSLIFFDSYDVDKTNKIISGLIKKEFDKNDYPTVRKIFDAVLKNDIKSFIMIPHFNNKTKGLRDKDMQIKAVECLRRSVFSAYEDSNNVKKINESFKVYSDYGYPNLPILIFSDCHDISVYPRYSEDREDEPEFLYFLGDLCHPFNSLKLAFQDPKVRIGSDKIANFRKIDSDLDRNYISSIVINGVEFGISPYQNTIIGGFGSGKTFLMNLILYGKNGFNKALLSRYSDLLETIDSFYINTHDGIPRKSLMELENEVIIIRFEQNEGIFYNSIIDETEKNRLEDKLKIEFPLLEPIKNVDFLQLVKKYNKVKSIINENITDSIDVKSYYLSKDFYEVVDDDDLLEINNEEYENQKVTILLKEELIKQVLGIPKYSKSEKQIIKKVIDIISGNDTKWECRVEKYNELVKYISDSKEIFNQAQIKSSRNVAANKRIHKNICSYLNKLYIAMDELKKQCYIVECRISEDVYNKYRELEMEVIQGSYTLVTKFKVDSDYQTINEALFSQNNRKETLFKSLLNSIITNCKFRQNREDIKDCVDKYFEEVFLHNFSSFQYDIRNDSGSIMKKSAGEKANMIIDLIFEITANNLEKGESAILLIDQPEDHLDNKNIDVNIVQRIRNMKKCDSVPQIIFVSHNANISITADSENIIIATKNIDSCSYENSGIECPDFVYKVCKILEGGRKALKTRGMKFSVSYAKEYKLSKGAKNE